MVSGDIHPPAQWLLHKNERFSGQGRGYVKHD